VISSYILGIDMGGTATRSLLAGLDHSSQKLGLGGPGNPYRVGVDEACRSLHTALEACIGGQTSTNSIEACCVGIAGRSHPQAEALVKRAFNGLQKPRDLLIRNDLDIALVAGLGASEGVLVLAGTGSGVVARGPRGEIRKGGYGPLPGDPGGGETLSRVALRAACMAADGVGPETSLAASLPQVLGVTEVRELLRALVEEGGGAARFMPAVCQAAEDGDRIAIEILSQGGRELADLVHTAVAEADLQGPGIQVVTAGGILGNARILREALVAALAEKGDRYQFGSHVDEPLWGAVAIAREAALA